MKMTLKTTFVVLVAALVMLPAAAHAQVGFVDTDDDGVYDLTLGGNPIDNCPLARNGDCEANELYCDVNLDGSASAKELIAGDQFDWNYNGIGDACDDADGDGVLDYLDNCRSVANADQDPAACTDTDGDGFEDPIDNCPTTYNPDQDNSDTDQYGDACDVCRYDNNPDQDPSVCARSSSSGSGNGNGGSGNASAVPGTTTPSNMNEFQQGNGGCQLVAGATPGAWAALAFVAAMAIAAVRRRA